MTWYSTRCWWPSVMLKRPIGSFRACRTTARAGAASRCGRVAPRCGSVFRRGPRRTRTSIAVSRRSSGSRGGSRVQSRRVPACLRACRERVGSAYCRLVHGLAGIVITPRRLAPPAGLPLAHDVGGENHRHGLRHDRIFRRLFLTAPPSFLPHHHHAAHGGGPVDRVPARSSAALSLAVDLRFTRSSTFD